MRSPRAKLDTGKRSASVMAGLGGQAGGQTDPSVEDLSDFLSKMDSCIAVNKRAADCLIKSSALEAEAGERDAESLNNTHTRLEDTLSGAEEDLGVSVRHTGEHPLSQHSSSG